LQIVAGVFLKDNLGLPPRRHRRPHEVGATLRYLPKYSSDLNQIELPYRKFKAYLRKLAARTVPSLHRAIRSFLHILKPRECARY
jgi:transposase